jgi:PAS domain S-box-containing protein
LDELSPLEFFRGHRIEWELLMPSLQQTSITRGLVLSFAVLIAIFLSFGIYSIHDISSISSLTRTIYDHPLMVSNAALQATVSITKMSRYMEDVVLYESPIRILKAIEAVEREEQAVYQNLDIVRDRILGKQGQQLEAQARALFEAWGPIRKEAIQLTRKQLRNRAADITAGEGADQVAALEEKMIKLTRFARATASQFLVEAEKQRSRASLTSLLFLATSFIAAALIVGFTLKRTASAETALRESKHLLTNAIDRAPIGMLMVAPEGNFIQVNHAFSKMVGYAEAELWKMHFSDITHPQDRHIGIAVVQKLLQGGDSQAHFEMRLIRKGGAIIHVLLTTSLLRDPHEKPLFFFTQAQDISARKNSEHQLRTSEQRFRELFDNMGSGVAIYESLDNGESFLFRDMNRFGLTHTGKNKEEVIGKDLREIFPGVENTGLLKVFKEVWRTGNPAHHPTTKYEDERLVLWLENYVCKLPSGELVAIYEDTTRKWLDEKEKKRLERQLFQAQKLESVGTLAGGIAHDFNNILASILGFTELALDEVCKGSVLERNLLEVYTAGKRARDLVKQILAFARQSGEERKPIQVSIIAKEALKLIRSTTPTSIEIERQIHSTALVMANPTQIHQIIMNLCTNAVHALENEEGRIRIRLEDILIQAQDSGAPMNLTPGPYLLLTVSDTGVGIPTELMTSIFEPYFTTKAAGKGTGMGLAMVDGIVASYGGKVTVESTPGKGSDFHVYLPITRHREDPDRPIEAELPIGTERILIVDDELAVARTSAELLDRLGYQVTFKTSSFEALELLRAKPMAFDLVISDMTMPHMTGDKLAIAMMEIRPDLPVIICTGYSHRISEEVAAGIGIKGFAYKPLVRADMAKLVRRVLDASMDTGRAQCVGSTHYTG